MVSRNIALHCDKQICLDLGEQSPVLQLRNGLCDWQPILGNQRTNRVMAHLLTWLVVAIILAGCSSRERYEPVSIEIKVPNSDSISIAQVGDEILEQGTLTEHDAVHVNDAISVRLLILDSHLIHPGFYLKKSEGDVGAVYFPAKDEQGGYIEGLYFNKDSSESSIFIRDADAICVKPGESLFRLKRCTSSSDFESTTHSYIASKDVRQTLVYNGRVEGKINVGYREYSGTTVSPIFHNDVEYDLEASSIIGYKGSRIEIIEATNEYLKYRVVRYFDE